MTEDDILSALPTGNAARGINRIGAITSGPIEEVSIPGYTKGDVKVFEPLKIVWLVRLR